MLSKGESDLKTHVIRQAFADGAPLVTFADLTAFADGLPNAYDVGFIFEHFHITEWAYDALCADDPDARAVAIDRICRAAWCALEAYRAAAGKRAIFWRTRPELSEYATGKGITLRLYMRTVIDETPAGVSMSVFNEGEPIHGWALEKRKSDAWHVWVKN